MEQRIQHRALLGLPPAIELENFVMDGRGHLEKREFFCYKCGNPMMLVGNDLYKCEACGVEYNRKLYDFDFNYREFRSNL